MPNRTTTHRPAGYQPPERETSREYKAACKIRSSKAWQSVRWSVLQSEPFCRLCRNRGETTPAEHGHHIQSVATRPDLALDADNVCPLCELCHEQVHRGAVETSMLNRRKEERR